MPPQLQGLMEHIRREPKKAGVLSILGALLLVLGIRAAIGGSGPQAASAGRIASMPTVTSGNDAGGQQSSPAMAALCDFIAKPIAPVTRNLFVVKMEYYPADGSRPVATSEIDAEGFWEQIEKLRASRADQEKARGILVGNLRVLAAKLDLQSTVMRNGSPKALVNGVLVGEGDTIEGFRVIKIEPKRIVVEREGVKLEVLFKF
jgi:hypothetical protein